MDVEPLRIGRIKREAEKTLGISLSGEMGVYLDQETLDELADSWPNDYLHRIEEFARMVEQPDFASFDKGSGAFRFLRFYAKGKRIEGVILEVQRKTGSGRWWFSRCYRCGGISMDGGTEFTRIPKKK